MKPIETLSFLTRAEGGALVVVLEGALDRTAVAAFSDRLHEAIRAGPTRLVVDCAALSEIDAAGLGTLVITARRARVTGCEVVLREPNPALRRMLALTALNRSLPIEGDERPRGDAA